MESPKLSYRPVRRLEECYNEGTLPPLTGIERFRISIPTCIWKREIWLSGYTLEVLWVFLSCYWIRIWQFYCKPTRLPPETVCLFQETFKTLNAFPDHCEVLQTKCLPRDAAPLHSLGRFTRHHRTCEQFWPLPVHNGRPRICSATIPVIAVPVFPAAKIIGIAADEDRYRWSWVHTVHFSLQVNTQERSRFHKLNIQTSL